MDRLLLLAGISTGEDHLFRLVDFLELPIVVVNRLFHKSAGIAVNAVQ